MDSDSFNPWNIDYFNPPTPHVPAPSPRVKTPRLIPEQNDLFTVQRDALKTLNALDALEDQMAGPDGRKYHRELKALRVQAENTYRVIRSYLDRYAA